MKPLSKIVNIVLLIVTLASPAILYVQPLLFPYIIAVIALTYISNRYLDIKQLSEEQLQLDAAFGARFHQVEEKFCHIENEMLTKEHFEEFKDDVNRVTNSYKDALQAISAQNTALVEDVSKLKLAVNFKKIGQ